MEKHYLVILGDAGNSHQTDMLTKIKKLGKSNKILDNLYLLSVPVNSNFDDMNKVRTYIAGERLGYCMVIAITSNLSCAWNVPGTSCELLVNVLKQIENQDEEK